MFNLLKFVFSPQQWVELFTFYGGGKDGGDAPDFGPLAAATEKAAELGYELGQDQLEENQRQYDQNYALQKPVSEMQLGLMGQTKEQGDDYFNYMKQFSRPVETNLFYETMGFTPEEIAQIESARAAEIAAFNATEQDRANQTRSFSFDVPTYNQEIPEGAIKGSELDRSAVIQSGASYQNPNYLGAPSMATMGRKDFDYNSPYLQARGARDPDAYYVKNANGTYKLVKPSLVAGTQTVTVDGVPSGYEASSVVRTPETDAMVAQMAAQATAREKAREAAERDYFLGLNTELANRIGATNTQVYNRYAGDIEAETGMAVADARAGFTNSINSAARQGLRYGFSPARLAAMASQQGVSQAAAQAAAANQTRNTAIDRMYTRGIGQAQQTITGANNNRSMRQQDDSLRFAKKLDLAGIYRNLPGASQGAYNTAINAGNSAVNNQLGVSGQYLQGMNAGTNTIMAGQQARINGLSNIAQMQTGMYNNQQSQGGFGSFLGTAAGMLGSYGLSKII